jgi:hypothetical protein
MLMHLLEPVPHILNTKTDLPPGCDTVIQKAMAKNPDDRYPTAGEMADALENATRALPTAALTPDQPPLDATVVAGATVIAGRSTPVPGSAATVVAPLPSLGASSRVGAGSSTMAAAPRTAAPKPASAPPPQAAGAESPKKRSPILLIAILGMGGIIVLGSAIGLFALGSRGSGPLAMLAGPKATQTTPAEGASSGGETNLKASATLPIVYPGTKAPTGTSAPSPTSDIPPTSAFTDTPAPTPTETATPEPLAPVIGGADKIAFINNKEIWAANLDGSDLQQLTQDGTLKTSLQWTPDGQAITYITAKCIEKVGLVDKVVEQVTCFNYADSVKQFEASPDGSLAAVTLYNQLYLVPYDLELLKGATTHDSLAALAECKDFAPYLKNFVTQVRWSADSQTIAAKLIANLGNGKQGDIIQLFSVSLCIPNPKAIDNFPPPRFEMDGYEKNPVIQNYGWDMAALFALNSIVRNDGFGHLYIYNTEMKKAYSKVDPVGGKCCYRDPAWSPDGSYLAFAFQNQGSGAGSSTQIYFIPYGSIGSEASYTPLPLPDITDPKEKPLIALRKAK